MISSYLHRYPFLRLLLPLIIGIVCGDVLFASCPAIFYRLFALSFALCVAVLTVLYFIKAYTRSPIFGIFVFLSFFLLGFGLMNYQLYRTSYTFSSETLIYRAVITEKPEAKERSFLCRAYLLESRDSLSVTFPRKNILLYFPKDSTSGSLRSGDEFLFSARLSPPRNNGNFEEFDYARYLSHQAISGTGYVASDHWTVLARDKHRSFRQTALRYREQILMLYTRLGFQGDELAVLSALTAGYKEELSEEIRESYSISGAAHVLALSGLHIGLLYGLLLFFLRRIPGHSTKVKMLRVMIVLSVLWGFAFLTGLSPSVVRSVLMCSLFAFSEFRTGNYFSLNVLAAAALLMLVYNPCWLFDVGFQLSFCAVASILLIQPRLYRIWPVKNRLLTYFWNLTTVSLAAQIGAAPLMLLYFSRFSMYFLLTNLLIITLVTVIMYAAVVMLMLTPLPVIQTAVAFVVNRLVKILNETVYWVEQLPFSSVDSVWISSLEVFGFYVLALLLVCYFRFYRVRYLFASLFCTLILCGYHVMMKYNDRPQKSLVFYNVRQCAVVHCIAPFGESWLTYADSVPDTKCLHRAASGYWNRLCLSTPHSVTSDYKDDYLFYRDNLLYFYGKRVCIVNDNRWENKETDSPANIDYLYLCKGYAGSLKSLTKLFSIKNVVLDASLTEYRKKKYIEECRRLGVRFISLAEEGSVCLLI